MSVYNTYTQPCNYYKSIFSIFFLHKITYEKEDKTNFSQVLLLLLRESFSILRTLSMLLSSNIINSAWSVAAIEQVNRFYFFICIASETNVLCCRRVQSLFLFIYRTDSLLIWCSSSVYYLQTNDDFVPTQMKISSHRFRRLIENS